MTASDPARIAAPSSPKAEQVLQAASRVFREQGYGSASMDAIAREAGVSKATLYAHFAGKDQLFAAIVGAECRRHSQTLTAPEIDRLDVREALSAIGRNFLELVLSAKARAIYRIVMAEAPRFPELGRAFYASGPAVVLARLADYLGAADARGTLRIEDPASRPSSSSPCCWDLCTCATFWVSQPNSAIAIPQGWSTRRSRSS